MSGYSRYETAFALILEPHVRTSAESTMVRREVITISIKEEILMVSLKAPGWNGRVISHRKMAIIRR
jgi:hypothetical protein